MCTVVVRTAATTGLRILALRDEFVARAFDDPGEWWPEHPGVIGGRDQLAGGTWCASDVASGATALLVNRTERRAGTPSRGLLPLVALEHGAAWPECVPHEAMAAFNLILAGPSGVTVWVWDAVTLTRQDLAGGTHMITSAGVDSDDERTTAFGPLFGAQDWLSVVAETRPSDAVGSLVVRVSADGRTYATVFGQLITARPGHLDIAHSRTPWLPETWTLLRREAAPQAEPERRAR